jgi:hypothetical protein
MCAPNSSARQAAASRLGVCGRKSWFMVSL